MAAWFRDFWAATPITATTDQLIVLAVVLLIFACLFWIGSRKRI